MCVSTTCVHVRLYVCVAIYIYYIVMPADIIHDCCSLPDSHISQTLVAHRLVQIRMNSAANQVMYRLRSSAWLRSSFPTDHHGQAETMCTNHWYIILHELMMSLRHCFFPLLFSTPSFSAYVSQDPVRSSSTWACTVCLCVCSSSPFLGPWGALA